MSEGDGRAAVDLGARIGALCDTAGWTQPELATRAGVSKATISKLVRGKTAEPKDKTKRGLARAFGWSDYDEMITSKDTAPPARAAQPAPPGAALAVATPEALQSLMAREEQRDELLAEMFNVLLGVRRDVRTLIERRPSGSAGANG